MGEEGKFSRFGIVNRRKMDKAAKQVLESIGLGDVIPSHPIDELSFEDRKLVEAGMAMKAEPQILVVDETTTALSQKGRDVIYRIMRRMRDDGKTVIFISHDLDELKSVCDNVTVMRDGIYVTTLHGDEITIDNMRQNMIGRELSEGYYRSDYEDSYDRDTVMLDVDGITLGNKLKNVSLKVHKGEILGVGGLTASWKG